MHAIATVVGAVHVVAPDLGHRDTLDRVGIGLSNVATGVVDLINESQAANAEAYCKDATDNEADFNDCVVNESPSGDQISTIQHGIAEVRSELKTQIRNNSVDRIIRGMLMIAVGFLLFRIHGSRTELFANGLLPKRKSTNSNEPDATPPAVAIQ